MKLAPKGAMRIETIPILLGVLVGLAGLGLLLDAWFAEEMVRRAERRSRPRRGRDRWGEALMGLGVLAVAAALVGRDTWRYSILSVVAGSLLLIWGLKRNGAYIRGVIGRAEHPGPREP
jgi:hypothetical protein